MSTTLQQGRGTGGGAAILGVEHGQEGVELGLDHLQLLQAAAVEGGTALLLRLFGWVGEWGRDGGGGVRNLGRLKKKEGEPCARVRRVCVC